MPARAFTHGYPFDPSYGWDLDGLLALEPPAPRDGFAAFWAARYTSALEVAPEPALQPTGATIGEHEVFDLRFTSTGGLTLGGWALLPADHRVERGVVVGHGYGGREGPGEPLPDVDAAAYFFPCFRGLGRSAAPAIPSDPLDHVLVDIHDRDRYVIGGCVEDLWAAVSALLALFPAATGRVVYSGISFGGGVGALAAPWDPRIVGLDLRLPTFGHQALRLALPCEGSGEAVRQFQARCGFDVMATLAYHDAAVAAGFLRVPTQVAVARFDPAVPPPGQFAVHNAVPAAVRRPFVLDAGHFEYPEQEQQHRDLDREVARLVMEL